MGQVSYKFEQTPKKELYLAGLPSNVDQAALNEMFSNAGYTVNYAKIHPDSKGLGVTTALVTLASVEEAAAAIASFNGASVTDEATATTGTANGHKPAHKAQSVVASLPSARAAAKASTGTVLSVRYAGKEQNPSKNLHITNLPSGMDETRLKELFSMLSPPAELLRAKLIPDAKGGSQTSAMVQVSSMEIAAQIIEQLNGQSVEFEG